MKYFLKLVVDKFTIEYHLPLVKCKKTTTINNKVQVVVQVVDFLDYVRLKVMTYLASVLLQVNQIIVKRFLLVRIMIKYLHQQLYQYMSHHQQDMSENAEKQLTIYVILIWRYQTV